MKTFVIASALIHLSLVAVALSEDKKPAATVDQAITCVRSPGQPFINMGFEFQARLRLMNVKYRLSYKFQESDRPAWKALLNDDTAEMYARLCATYFLVDKDAGGRQFLTQQIKSADLRHRYNAAAVSAMFLNDNPSATWGVDLLIEQLTNRSLDGSGVDSTPSGDFPAGDRDDIIFSPIDLICDSFATRKETKAVPALRGLLKRGQSIDRAASALGEIGDLSAAPDLLEVLVHPTNYIFDDDKVVWALAALKYKPAVPVLVSMLSGKCSHYTKGVILDSLLKIGDPAAIGGIQKFLEGDPPHELKTAARRVLVLMQDRDPVPGLLRLFDDEKDESAQNDIITALARFRDRRVVNKFAEIARNSGSAYLREYAISGLEQVDNRQALLELASLLDVAFPKNLKNPFWGGKEKRPDYSKYFPQMVEIILKRVTHQNFARDSAKWKAYIEKNVAE